MSYRLYWAPETCARVSLAALEETGAPFEVDHVDRAAPAYRAVNPKGKVPALRDGDRVITETPAILLHLARAHPESRLLPRDEVGALSDLSWFAAGIHPHITRLRFPERFCDVPAGHDRVRALALAPLEHAFALLERRLAGREWLHGEWSLVDAYAQWLWFRATGSGMDGAALPRTAAHAERTAARPSVARAIDRERGGSR